MHQVTLVAYHKASLRANAVGGGADNMQLTGTKSSDSE